MLTRRELLSTTLLLVPLLRAGAAAAAQLLAVRVWPAPDYSRVTLETSEPLQVKQTLLRNPDRLVVDIPGVELDGALRELVAKVKPDDPYIAAVRVGQPELKLVRIVFDLRTRVLPRSYTLTPVAQYQYRQVFDLYPQEAPDPIAALLQSRVSPDSAMPAADPLGELIAQRDGVNRMRSDTERAQALLNGGAGSGVNEASSPNNVGRTSPSTAQSTPRRPASTATSGAPLASRSAPLLTANSAPTPTILSQPVAPALLRGRSFTITLDPGHGGEDPGAVGPAGTYEKHVVLAIADQLRDLLLATPGMRVLMTRDSDFFVPLGQRVAKARRVKSDLFISVHADAFSNASARGASVFALSEHGASSTLARFMARRENSSDEIGGVSYGKHEASIVNVLLDLSTSGQIQQSKLLGGRVLQQLARIGNLHSRNVEQASFAVLKAPDVPSILVESAFISNPEEEARLRQRDYQHEIALAVYGGLRHHLRI